MGTYSIRATTARAGDLRGAVQVALHPKAPLALAVDVKVPAYANGKVGQEFMALAEVFPKPGDGQVDVGGNTRALATDVLGLVKAQSGEGRFRWLHAKPGRARSLAEAATAAHGNEAWVVTIDQVRDEHWFGPSLPSSTAARLGDVALVAHADVSFDDPEDTGPYQLVSRHGSLTSAEMRIPLLAARATNG